MIVEKTHSFPYLRMPLRPTSTLVSFTSYEKKPSLSVQSGTPRGVRVTLIT